MDLFCSSFVKTKKARITPPNVKATTDPERGIVCANCEIIVLVDASGGFRHQMSTNEMTAMAKPKNMGIAVFPSIFRLLPLGKLRY